MDWVRVEERLPDVMAKKFDVETSDGNVIQCFFYLDGMSWISFYGLEPCYWWNTNSLKPQYNVVKWKECTQI